MWPTGGGNGNSFQDFCLEIKWTVWKGKKIWCWKMNPPPKFKTVQYATGAEWRTITNSSRKKETTGLKQKGQSVVHISSGESNRQVWSWNTKWSRTKANIALSRETTGHSKSPFPTAQNKMNYVRCSQSWRSSLQSTKTRHGDDSGSDDELLIANFRLTLKE